MERFGYLRGVVQSIDERTLRIGRSREERAWVGADPLHSAVYAALQDDRFKWRTVRGVAGQLGVAPELVASSIDQLSDVLDNVCRSSVQSGRREDLFTTRDHYTERTSGVKRFLDSMTGTIGY